MSKITSGNNVEFVYKDQLTDAKIRSIITDINLAASFWDPEIKELLYHAAGLDVPSPLPAPRHISAADMRQIQDVYLERKKELLD